MSAYLKYKDKTIATGWPATAIVILAIWLIAACSILFVLLIRWATS